MTITSAVAGLVREMKSMAVLFDELFTSIEEDKPLQDDLKFSELLGTAVSDLRGWQTEAVEAGVAAWQAVADQSDLEAARIALTRCQDSFNRVLYHFSFDLFSYERMDELYRIGYERKGEWHAWAGVVGNTLGRCQWQLMRANEALSQYWQEIAYQTTAGSVSVRATNIGQQIASNEDWYAKQSEHT